MGDRTDGAAEAGLFVGAAITVSHDAAPPLVKRPGPPDAFTWEGREYRIVDVIREWHDYRPRGSDDTFYVKERGSYRARAASRHGTFGVGRDYFRVRTDSGEVFDVYYDRKPRNRDHPEGGWFLWRQLPAACQ